MNREERIKQLKLEQELFENEQYQLRKQLDRKHQLLDLNIMYKKQYEERIEREEKEGVFFPLKKIELQEYDDNIKELMFEIMELDMKVIEC